MNLWLSALRAPILVSKNWLGHRNVQNTLIYMQVLRQDTRRFYENLSFDRETYAEYSDKYVSIRR